jgi:branched-chain amino acid transport system ATP-binding protein
VAAAPPRAGAVMSEALLQVTGLGKRFGGFVALEGVSLDIKEGERVGLIGPNGSGKSTLVNCLSGTLKHDSGQVYFDGHAFDGLPAYRRTRLGLARSFQLPKPFRGLTVVQNLHVPLLFTAKHRAGAAMSAAEIDARCEELLRLVALEGKARARPRDLTQIEMRKLELARAMAAAPKLLIADEAMAGLSHSEVDDILALLVKLNQSGVTVILIEHIMRAVMSFSDRLICLVAGRKVADGTPREVVGNPEVERAYLGE